MNDEWQQTNQIVMSVQTAELRQSGINEAPTLNLSCGLVNIARGQCFLKIEAEKNRIIHILNLEKAVPILDPFPKQKKSAKIVLPTGAEYNGQLVRDEPNGFGYKKTDKGEKYLGDFKKGMENGYGRLYDQKGILSYEGLWRDGIPLKNTNRTR